MAWTNITNAQLAIGAPIRSIDLLALRDNITAQANGDAGAPKQQTAGIADLAVTAQKIKYGAGLTASGDTLVTSSPTFGAVGSYAAVAGTYATTYVAGSNYVLDAYTFQISVFGINADYQIIIETQGLSGTWKWMSATTNATSNYRPFGIAVRVA